VRSDAVAAGPESRGGCVLGVILLLSLLEKKISRVIREEKMFSE
jgi:hypothetical protein